MKFTNVWPRRPNGLASWLVRCESCGRGVRRDRQQLHTTKCKGAK